MTDHRYYFYIEEGQQRGPVAIDQLPGLITSQTLVWREGMAEWMIADRIPEVQALLSTAGSVTADAPQQPTYPAPPAIPAVPSPLYQPTKPNNYLVWSILLTVLCGSVPGMIGIALGITCNQRYAEGDYKGAELASSMAKNCLIVSVVLALILIGVLVMMLTSFGSALYSLTEVLENS